MVASNEDAAVVRLANLQVGTSASVRGSHVLRAQRRRRSPAENHAHGRRDDDGPALRYTQPNVRLGVG